MRVDFTAINLHVCAMSRPGDFVRVHKNLIFDGLQKVQTGRAC